MNRDQQLLSELFQFMRARNFITIDDASLLDMVTRYKAPPLTRLNRVAMQLTISDYNRLVGILERINAHLNPEPAEETESDPVYTHNQETGQLERIGTITEEGFKATDESQPA